ncbi:MAG: NAD-dependent epimerase/dehydratase family protein [Thermoproteota archaeon]
MKKNSTDKIETTLKLILDKGIDKDFFGSRSFIITGGAGFLGSWIAEAICELGGKVICIDDFSTSNKSNLENLIRSKNFRLIKESITSVELSGLKSDFVFHLASRPSPDDYQQNPVESLLPNSTGSHRLLEYCRKKKIPVAFASTSEVYGDAAVIPTPEKYWGNVNPIGLRSCYDEGKRYAEALFMAYARQHKTPVKIFRLFNTYGPRLRSDGTYGRAISRFLMQALENKDITIYGDGKQTRSFCYVTDTIRAIMYYAQSDVVSDIINIGNPSEITINKLAEIIIEATGSRSSLSFLPPAPDDPRRRCPDITKAKELLKWHPQIDLHRGIRMTLEWNGRLN